jgi:hypothetical protein
MNGPTKEKTKKNIGKLIERIIDESQDIIMEVVCDEAENRVKGTLHDLFEEMAWDELDEDEAPPMSDEYENEVLCAIRAALYSNDKKINDLIDATR